MPETWNSDQVRVAADKITEEMLRKLTERHPELKGASAGDKLLQWSPLAIALLTAFWTLAIQSKQVEQNRLDIIKIESRVESSSNTMQSVDTRLARIETTLNIITGGDGKGGRLNAGNPTP